MVELPLTRASLLIRLRDGQDRDAWRQFVDLYAPLVYGFARRRGLQDADAADLMQDVLRSISSAVGRLDYDPAHGTFRAWLFTITRNKLYNHLDRKRHQVQPAADSTTRMALEQHAGNDGHEEQWEQEYRRRLSARAMEQVRGEFQEATWKAFWMTAVENRPAKEVGEALGMSVGAVYVARSRIVSRLREQVQQFELEEVG